MMENLSESLTFTVPLSSDAHRFAEQFRRQQSNQKKAKQVYLNTLAVSAVNFYLSCMGIKTDWEASQSRNPVMQTFMDVADLSIPNKGKLECCPVLPDTSVVQIPPEVWSDRIGYVAVQFDKSLREATLLGFTPTVPESGELPVDCLRSLEDLLLHIHQIGQSLEAEKKLASIVGSDSQPVNLSQWFQNIFETGWQSISALLGTEEQNLGFSLRSASSAGETSVKRAKLIDLGLRLGSQSVALLVALAPEDEQNVGVLVQVHPVGGETYLPPNLRLGLLSESGETLQEVQSRFQDNYIQLKRFQGGAGESFKLQVAFGDVSMKEAFVI
ncbi:DUF1822 family protein [Trichocoleus sp. FACHB-90]|uniref:DUF1822 family protein n=1 Tax=Cyanophyceae TaxID=3028117 RepID=UPI0016868852|nr:DUF1822 family protein [Trichocoleus sp. FACHB-90]MBD1930035.1 DUF1822 family protein [Trichocoleus sp. FACHB-90]